jgi:hypothetical protein
MAAARREVLLDPDNLSTQLQPASRDERAHSKSRRDSTVRGRLGSCILPRGGCAKLPRWRARQRAAR